MTDPIFVHLRVHSAYSLSEGAIKVEKLVELCARHNMPAVALTDTGNLFGALAFALAASEAGIQPIVGCQLSLKPEDTGGGSAMGGVRRPPADHIVLLVKDETGYRNLIHLVSRAFLDAPAGEEPRVGLADLLARADGLIALTGGTRGRLNRLLAQGQIPAAELYFERLRRAFAGRLYVELMRHGEARGETGIEPVENALLDLAYRFDIPLVATNDVYFADPAMYEAQDALICIAEGTHVETADRRRLTPEHWFKPADMMAALFADLPEAVANTVTIARRCAFMPEKRKPILPAYATTGGRDEAGELLHQAEEGLRARLALLALGEGHERERAEGPYWSRLRFELDVIQKMGFAGYFLIVADFIRWAKSQAIPVGPGRGSGAGSVVAWALTITDLDPLRFGLLFERFLNPERISMPDFDIDFCQDRRDEVLRYVQRKYGADRVAQIITFGQLQARAALRDVGRVLQLPYSQVDRVCKLVPNNPAKPVKLQEAIDGEPQLRQMIAADERLAQMVRIALQLEGLYRHASTHAAGVVIGERPLTDIVPLYRDPRSDLPVTQFSMKYVELAGLVKFDFLGLKTLTVLAQTERLLGKRGVAIDLATLPLDDPATYAMLGRAEATGVFQMESSGMRDVLRRLKPDRFEDIIAIVALYRPGPMDNIPRYIACKHGREAAAYPHPNLEPILRETFGIMIYQEQVMQIAQVLSGFSLGAADLLRRAMGKKDKKVMEGQRRAFVDGAVARGVSAASAAEIFELVFKFAEYGFNKSHAAAYALVAYQTAYLKANYPVEFFAASMTLDLGNTDKLAVFRQELDKLGISLLPPDINRSDADFSVEETGEGKRVVRYALAAIRNVGRQAMEAVVAERKRNGPYKSLIDFAERMDGRHVNKRQMESLVRAGTFDGLHPNRAQVFHAIESLLKIANAAANDRADQQSSLFGGPSAQPPLRLPAVEDWGLLERLKQEFEAVGFYLSSHPLDAYGRSLQRLGVVPAADIAKRVVQGGSRPAERGKWGERSGSKLVVAGTVIGKQERLSAKGSRFAFVQLSDPSGQFEVVVFSEQLAQSRELIEAGTALLIAVEARAEDGGARLSAQAIESLDKAVARRSDGIKIVINEALVVARLKAAIEAGGAGRGKVSLVVPTQAGSEVEIALPGGFGLTGETRAALTALPGVTALIET